MSGIGQERRESAQHSHKAKRGRPRKKPDYDRDKNMQQLLDRAVSLFQVPFDDRDERPPDAPTISAVANQMNTSRMRVRKLLITAEMYSTGTSRKIQKLHAEGKTVPEICVITGLGRAAVHNYLPYEKCIYKMDELSVNAEKCSQFKWRKRASEELLEHREEGAECLGCLWEAVQAFEEYNFRPKDNIHFRYSISDSDDICFEGAIFSRDEIEKAFQKAIEIQDEECLPGKAEKTCCNGAKEICAVFLRIGACCKSLEFS